MLRTCSLSGRHKSCQVISCKEFLLHLRRGQKVEFQNSINPKISQNKKITYKKGQNVKVKVTLITLLKRKPLAEITFGLLRNPINLNFEPNKTNPTCSKLARSVINRCQVNKNGLKGTSWVYLSM